MHYIDDILRYVRVLEDAWSLEGRDSLVQDLTVVIPAKNEAATLPEVLEQCAKHTSNILVVDGVSTDGTLEIAAKFGAEVINDME